MTTNSRTLQRAEHRRHAKTAARLAGCTCQPDLRHRPEGHVTVLHDPWCPAREAASQIVVYFPERCGR